MLSGRCLALLIFFSGCSVCLAEDYSEELPRIEPTLATGALSTFEVAEGFEMQMVASEPLIATPVEVQWDARGGMFVCEMRGYSEDRDRRISSIARLTDEDDDGVYDRRTTYADGLFWPTGIFPYDGGLFVGDAPDLWYLKDLDGDGVADIKKRVLTGFGTSNVQGLLNSFRWGLDHRIHIACSSSSGSIRRQSDPVDSSGMSIRGRDIALNPRTLSFEATSGAAQHGMSFNDWGQKFVCSNSDHIQQVMYEDRYLSQNPYVIAPPSRVSIANDGPQAEVFRRSPVEPWRIVRTRLRVSGKAKGPIEGGGRAAGYFTGASGITIYKGDAWPSHWKGTAIVGDVGGNLIHRKRLEQQGLVLAASRIDSQSELVASRDIWFRPAQFANAPDGSLFVVDVYREVIEHPKSLPPEIKRHLDLTSGRERGRIYRLAPVGFRFQSRGRLADLSTRELVRLLAHPNAWHRETASRLLYERRDVAAVEPLRQMATTHSDPLARIHAMWAIASSWSEHALDAGILLPNLMHEHPQVRRHAIRLSEERISEPEIVGRLAQMVNDDSLDVRYQLAFSAAGLPANVRLRLLAELAKEDIENSWMRFAISLSIGDQAAMLANSFGEPNDQQKSEADDFLDELHHQVAARQRQPTRPARPKGSAGAEHVAPTAEEAERRNTLIRRYQAALTLEGSADRGLQVFKRHCSACHRVGNVGFAIGPSLAAMKFRGPAAILTGVLDPNREVNPLYNLTQVLTKDGQVFSGMVVSENASGIAIRMPNEQIQSILRIDIETIRHTERSFMPEGFEMILDTQKMADLIQFVMTGN